MNQDNIGYNHYEKSKKRGRGKPSRCMLSKHKKNPRTQRYMTHPSSSVLEYSTDPVSHPHIIMQKEKKKKEKKGGKKRKKSPIPYPKAIRMNGMICLQ